MQYQIQKMTAGGILDTAFKVFRDNLLVLLGIALTIQAISFGTVTVLQKILSTVNDPDEVVGTLVLGIPPLIALFVLSPLGTAISTKIVSDRYLGRAVSLADALAAAFKVIVPLLIALLISTILSTVGFFLFLIPGVFLVLKFALIAPVVVVEKGGAKAAMHRSWSLTEGSMVTLILLYALVWTANIILGGTIYASLGAGLAPEALAQVFGAVINCFFSVAITVTYFERRCAKEGFDMDLLAQSFDG